jgi:hypothetical protein
VAGTNNCHSDSEGGDRLKFGDIITAVASFTVIALLLFSVFLAVFVPVDPYLGIDVANILSILVASLIVGYVFAVKIQEESRIGAISSIAVLFAVVMMFTFMASVAVNPYMGAMMKEGLESMFSTSGWTTTDWLGYSEFVVVMMAAINVVFALVFGFIGLYVGSRLKKPSKS